METLKQENIIESPRTEVFTPDSPQDTDADNAASSSPSLILRLVALVNEIPSNTEHRKIFRAECGNLIRRIRLLAPLFEEMKEFKGKLPDQAFVSLAAFEKALRDACELLHSCFSESKIFLVVERERVLDRFLSVTAELEHALENVPLNVLEISDEVREQVDLVHAQLKRAKGRVDMQDQHLYNDIDGILFQENGKGVNSAALINLAERLSLRTLPEINRERIALDCIIASNGGIRNSRIDQMIQVLALFKELARSNSVSVDIENENVETENTEAPSIPDDFRCPISLELMRDPVIVATGQTYERACIQKWLDAGNKTCPKTQQVLTHLLLTPNFVLKSLIAQWCETNGIELPKQRSSSERDIIEVLLQKLSLGQPDVQRDAAGELRMLAKKNTENRICIAEAGAIPHLVGLLSSEDLGTQEHAVTALLNLSIYDGNKGAIIASKAIPSIIEVLKNGSMEARENAAATLFSLSVIDQNKVAIGASGAIPALVKLLCDGTLRGKKDAATALFNLCIYQGNKPRAVRANVIPPLMEILQEPSSEMVDESLAILSILATHPEGRTAISQASAIPLLIDLIQTGSPRNKENAAAVLLALCTNGPLHLMRLKSLGAYGPLCELERTGTPRARRKAALLLESIRMEDFDGPKLNERRY